MSVPTFVLFLCALLPPSAPAQKTAEEPPWERLRFLVGAWEGRETGKAGVGKGERQYRFIMNGRYLHVENTSRFEPQEGNPSGELHEDVGFLDAKDSALTADFYGRASRTIVSAALAAVRREVSMV